MVIRYLNREIKPCGRSTQRSPDSYYFFPLGDAKKQYPLDVGGDYLRETGINGTCGQNWSNLKLCADCLRRLGVFW